MFYPPNLGTAHQRWEALSPREMGDEVVLIFRDHFHYRYVTLFECISGTECSEGDPSSRHTIPEIIRALNLIP